MSHEIKPEDIPQFTPDMTFEERKKIWVRISPSLDEAGFDAMMAENKSRQMKVPKVGDEAPDFELDILDGEQGRTGEKLRLSALRGKPVGLFFGSYT